MNNKLETGLSFPFPLAGLQVFVDGYMNTRRVLLMARQAKCIMGIFLLVQCIVGNGGYFLKYYPIGILAIDQPQMDYLGTYPAIHLIKLMFDCLL